MTPISGASAISKPGKGKKLKKPLETRLREEGFSEEEIRAIEKTLDKKVAGTLVDQEDPRFLRDLIRSQRLRQLQQLVEIPAGERHLKALRSRAGWGPHGNAPGAGPQYGTVEELTLEPFDWGHDQIQALQNKLVAAGLMQREQFHAGLFDPPTRTAYYAAVRESAVSNKTPFELLTDYEMQRPDVSARFAPGAFVRQDPAFVEETVDDIFRAAAGKSPDPEEKRRLISRYREIEHRRYATAIAEDRYAFEVETGASQGAPTLTEWDPAAQVKADVEDSPEAMEYEGLSLSLALRSLFRGE